MTDRLNNIIINNKDNKKWFSKSCRFKMERLKLSDFTQAV